MKIVITGGHLSPAFSIIEKLPKDTEVLIIGRTHTFEGDDHLSFEYRSAQKKNIAFKGIITGRLQREFTKHTIPSLLKVPRGFGQSLAILSSFKPNIVVSFGGYVSVPVVLAAYTLKIPIVIHEQTLSAGLANKFASNFAKKICISWERSARFFPKEKTVLTGNPIRELTMNSSQLTIPEGKLPLLYVTGGSSGSHAINVLIEKNLKALLSQFRIIHQTGDAWEFKDFERISELISTFPKKLTERYVLTKFIEQDAVGEVFSKADFVISRSGINTITELLYFQKPALLIPLNKEQKENAEYFKSLGVGDYLDQKTLTPPDFYTHLIYFFEKLPEYKEKAADVSNVVVKDAGDNIIKVIYEEAKI